MDDPIKAARQSFSGKTMTEAQLKEAVAIADILHSEIERSGSFIEKLTDYSHAFARSEKFDAMRAEKMIRDVYMATKGQSLNQTRERLMAAEDSLTAVSLTRALQCAETIGQQIQAPPTQPFYQAYDRAAVTLASEFSITQNAAKALMKDSFKQQHGQDLYAYGKEIEQAYHKPAREAEMAARRAEQTQARSQSQSFS